jgi:transcription antitermination factor NusG
MKPLSTVFSPEVMAELARPVQSFDPRNAEIVAGKTPKWYLLEVHEPAQRDVEAELAKRRFGVFVPQEKQTVVERGRKFDRIRLLFPGYIFVFVWDIDRHWSRITSIHGVSQVIVSQPSAAAPAEAIWVSDRQCPIVIEDEMIDYLRALENGAPPRKPRHRGKRQHDDDVMAVYPWSAFPDRIWMLDSEERNQTLRKALGLS